MKLSHQQDCTCERCAQKWENHGFQVRDQQSEMVQDILAQINEARELKKLGLYPFLSEDVDATRTLMDYKDDEVVKATEKASRFIEVSRKLEV